MLVGANTVTVEEALSAAFRMEGQDDTAASRVDRSGTMVATVTMVVPLPTGLLSGLLSGDGEGEGEGDIMLGGMSTRSITLTTELPAIASGMMMRASLTMGPMLQAGSNRAQQGGREA